MSVHTLVASAETVKVGMIRRAYAPVLSIEAGDEVVLNTWGLWGDAVTPQTTFADVQRIKQQYAGYGPHSMTGPIAVRGAKPGMTLSVEILELQLGPHGFNMITPPPHSRGLLTARFPQGEIRHFTLDRQRMQTELLPGLTLPLRPFLGIMGVAPDDDEPHVSSVPDVFGGNIDCPDLIAGATLYLPVLVDEALFYAGDAHAAQGCGEVNQTALETTMERVRLRFGLLQGTRPRRPHAQTATHLITMGFDPDLRQAAIQAVADMVDWLSTEYALSAADAYVLCSLQADLMVTQAVNGNNGIHARLPKSLVAGHVRQTTATDKKEYQNG